MANNRKIFNSLYPAEPSVGLFDRIINAIKQEQELRQTKKILIGFLALLIVSVFSAPFSTAILANQVKSSGIMYFISAAANDLSSFMTFWKYYFLAVLESLPIVGMIAFIANVALALFTLRLFLYKKQFLFRYLSHNLKTNLI
jgi:hypothetical protein